MENPFRVSMPQGSSSAESSGSTTQADPASPTERCSAGSRGQARLWARLLRWLDAVLADRDARRDVLALAAFRLGDDEHVFAGLQVGARAGRELNDRGGRRHDDSLLAV